ncbi:hypothetical protein [uncultured Aliiroseovarius sp.]|uniref:hypothetical protein n=1 Tax=uncultured Aliiroseovarius sp. TaxID=1658783 RepID=UPI002595CBDD|nr:hypothetical protein [uncultured Aliiroseovarius sp.]
MLAWLIVFAALLVKLPFLIAVVIAGFTVLLNVRYSNWLCAHEEKLVFINRFAMEHAFPSSPQNDRAQFNMQLAGFLCFFCVPLVFAYVANLENSQPLHFFYALLCFAAGVFAVTGVIHTLVRRVNNRNSASSP